MSIFLGQSSGSSLDCVFIEKTSESWSVPEFWLFCARKISAMEAGRRRGYEIVVWFCCVSYGGFVLAQYSSTICASRESPPHQDKCPRVYYETLCFSIF